MQAVIDEVIEKTAEFSGEEYDKLIRTLQERKRKANSLYKKNPNPNIEWLKEHHAEYAGNHVALFEGELIAFGRTIKEADTKAKEKGYKKTLLHYIPAEDEQEQNNILGEDKQEQKKNNRKNGNKGYVSPNTIWVKENHDKYAGNYVALKDGELVAYGKTIKEADTKAKESGVDKPLLHYIPAKDEEVWGGW